MADVKKEKELAEKRKNDPPLELSNDHPVRKLISRFRKISDAKHAQTSSDAERGLPNGIINSSNGDRPRSGTRVINVSEQSGTSTKLSSVPENTGGSKWGKLMGGLGGGGTKTASDNNQNKIPLNELKPTKKSPEESGAPASQVTSFKTSKWGKYLESHPEPIQESPNEEVAPNLKKADSADSGILHSNNRLDQIEEVSASVSSANVSCVPKRITTTDVTSGLTVAEQHMLTSLYNIRLEIKEDMDTIGQKMNRIDEQMREILRFFSPSSTPCSSLMSTYPSSRYNTNNITSSNSAEHSPRHSSPSSPGQFKSDTASDQKPSLSSSITSVEEVSPEKTSIDSTSSSKPNQSSRRSSKVSSGSVASNASVGSSGKRKSPDSKGKGGKVAPESTGAPQDDENIRVKDQDLDIL